MKLYNILMMSMLPIASYAISPEEETKNPELTSFKKNYTIVVDRDQFDLQEGARVGIISKGDTTYTTTNHIGIADIRANPKDTLLIQPTKQTKNFQDLEKIVGDKTFQIIYVNSQKSTANNYELKK